MFTLFCAILSRGSLIYELLNENFHASKCVRAGGQVDLDKIPSLHEKKSDGLPILLGM